MSKQLHKSMQDLNTLFLKYCAEVEQNVHLAVQSFMKTDPKNIEVVIQKDKEIDRMEMSIEEECLRIMAIYQPLAKDLRFLVGILKMNNDLERIGDLAVNIVKKVTLFIDKEESLAKLDSMFFLPEMIQKSLDMLKKSLDSFTKKDPNLAREVCQIDHDVDLLKEEIKVLVLNKMKETPEKIKLLSGILRNLYHLERIADLSTNISEDVIYLVEGDIMRRGVLNSHSKPNVLILCTGNSCRSQMAEGITRQLFGDICEVYSAGTHPSSVNKKAIEVMNEIGIDISSFTSKSITRFQGHHLDIVITVCDAAKETCPVLSGKYTQLHWAFKDPVGLSLDTFREVRDAINHKFKSDLEPYIKDLSI